MSETSNGSPQPVRGPLSETDLQWLSRCMAVAGSGSYALRGTQEQQVIVFRQILIAAKARGADWPRICLAVYEVSRHMMGHFPSLQEMISQVWNVADAER